MMRKIVFAMALAVLAGCEATKRRTGRTAESDRLDSIAEYQRTHCHEYSTELSCGNLYRLHDPDCPLCRETRRRETIAVVDSMLRERMNNLKE